MREARRGLGSIYRRGVTWWVQYSHRGIKRRETSRSANRADAVRLLKKRLAEMGSGRLIGPDAERVTLADLKRMVLDDYALNGNRTASRASQCLAHVVGYFGAATRALDVTADRLVTYAKSRQDEGAAPATVKYELAILRRGFNLAVRAGRLPQRPAFPAIEAHNRRTGFFEDAEFRAVLAHLPREVAAVAEFLYWSGWRRGEALALEWRMVDLAAGIIRIEDSKNGEPRTLPFRVLPDLAALIERQRERTSAVEAATGRIIPWVFSRDGEPLHSFRRAWLNACKSAGLPHRIVHDFRRTAARNLSRAGVPEGVIMKLCGWRTRSVFDRYRIVNEQDLTDGLAKLARVSVEAPSPTPSEAVPLRTSTIQAQSAAAGEIGLC